MNGTSAGSVHGLPLVPPEHFQTPEGSDDETSQSSMSPCVEEQTRPPVDLLALASSIMTQHETTQLTGFPSFVAERLYRLDITQRTYAERIILEVLDAAAAGKLTETTTLTSSDQQPSDQFYWGHQQEPMHSTSTNNAAATITETLIVEKLLSRQKLLEKTSVRLLEAVTQLSQQIKLQGRTQQHLLAHRRGKF
ncbi:unnamed protein product [Ranitomeya imitator]|uniref:Uncharacterized protein n=1 Tax=Ranitomeya imitator TaxID=111125 RepID=A0ABN9L260_9NEOB|nr:unnamed protein product [Ranitomeya imitator]